MKMRTTALAVITMGAALLPLDTARAATTTYLTVNTTADSVDANTANATCADAMGRCSLRAAIQTANAAAGPVSIRLGAGTHALSIGGPGLELDAAVGDLDVTTPNQVTITGTTGTIIDAAGLGDRAVEVAQGSSLRLQRVTIQNGDLIGGYSGGAIFNAGTLSVESSTLRDNRAVVIGVGASDPSLYASGGAIYSRGNLTVRSSTLTGNQASRAGGAIELAGGGTTLIQSTTLAGNSTGASPGNGGAVHLTGAGTVTVSSSTVRNNVAAAEGGGLWNSSIGTMSVTGSTISGNVANGTAADNGGGGLFNDGGQMRVTSTTITANAAPAGSGSGGGILTSGGSLTVGTSQIRSNAAARAGGGIEAINGTVVVSSSQLESNSTGSAPGNGGAVHVSGTSGTFEITGSTIRNNVAALEGGGLWAGAGSSSMTVRGSVISGNVANGTGATNGGGGLFNKGGSLHVIGSTISDNHADNGSGSGGGILNLGTLTVSSTVLDANTAARAGGGIESNNVNGAGDADLRSVTMRNNTTGPTPGNGGGMHVTQDPMLAQVVTTIDDSTVTGNTATNEGGGLWNASGAIMTVTDTTISNNQAPLGPNVFQKGATGGFTVDGFLIVAGDNDLSFP